MNSCFDNALKSGSARFGLFWNFLSVYFGAGKVEARWFSNALGPISENSFTSKFWEWNSQLGSYSIRFNNRPAGQSSVPHTIFLTIQSLLVVKTECGRLDSHVKNVQSSVGKCSVVAFPRPHGWRLGRSMLQKRRQAQWNDSVQLTVIAPSIARWPPNRTCKTTVNLTRWRLGRLIKCCSWLLPTWPPVEKLPKVWDSESPKNRGWFHKLAPLFSTKKICCDPAKFGANATDNLYRKLHQLVCADKLFACELT